RRPIRKSFPVCCAPPKSGTRNRPTATTTASPIRRMGTSIWMAGGSLADDAARKPWPRPVRAWLFDHLSGPQEERLRDGEPECLCGLHVDDQIEIGWLLHGQVPRLRALQDPVYVDRSLTPHGRRAGSVKHQSAGCHVVLVTIHRRETTPSREFHDQRAVRLQHRVRGRHKSVRRSPAYRVESRIESGSIVRSQRLYRDL